MKDLDKLLNDISLLAVRHKVDERSLGKIIQDNEAGLKRIRNRKQAYRDYLDSIPIRNKIVVKRKFEGETYVALGLEYGVRPGTLGAAAREIREYYASSYRADASRLGEFARELDVSLNDMYSIIVDTFEKTRARHIGNLIFYHGDYTTSDTIDNIISITDFLDDWDHVDFSIKRNGSEITKILIKGHDPIDYIATWYDDEMD